MANGIYCYYDNLKCEIVYVGKDSYIDKNTRHRQHYQPSKRDEQHINQVLQNDNKSGRYSYAVLEQGDFTNDELNQKEISWIAFCKPRFCFTEGGEGTLGYKHTEEACEKIRKARTGTKHSKETCEKISKTLIGKCSGENNPMYGKTGENHPSYGKPGYWKDKKFSKEHCEKLSCVNSGEKNPNAKYQNAFWDINNVNYNKSDMFKDGNSDGLKPRRCFKLKHKGKKLNIGNFHEWISIEIISQKINEYQ